MNGCCTRCSVIPPDDPKPDAAASQLMALASAMAKMAETQAMMLDTIEGLQRQVAEMERKSELGW
jgi:hypothetical protein